MIAGCYSTHLYCDFADDSYQHRGSGEFPGPGFGEFHGRTRADTLRQARTKGWWIGQGPAPRTLCPSCRRQGRKLPSNSKDQHA